MKKIILAVLTVVLFSCSSDYSLTPSTKVVIGEPEAYFRANLNGEARDYTKSSLNDSRFKNLVETGFLGTGAEHSIYYASEMESTFFNMYFEPSKLGIEYDNMFISNDDSTETSAFFGLFYSAPTNFISKTEYDNWVKGVQVTYDRNGTYFSTLGGDQTGSTIAITDKTELTVPGLEGMIKSVILKGTVNCKLYNYNEPSADPIVLTNGKFKLYFHEYE